MNMIKMMTAYTTEIDEVDDAFEEIMKQLDMSALRKHTAGLLTCHTDYVETDFIQELAIRLPFQIIGTTTLASATPAGYSLYALSLAVITSDDVLFATAMTDDLAIDNYQECMENAYRSARQKLTEDPSLVVAFFPYLEDVGGSEMVQALDRVCGGAPVWGGVATNSTMSFEHCRTICNGASRQKAMSILLMCGSVTPEFISVSILPENIRDNRGIITDSDGRLLKAVNDTPILDYLGFMDIENIGNAMSMTPFVVHYEKDSAPVALAIYQINEDGSIVCGGDMPVGAGFSVGTISSDGIISTAKASIRQLLESGKHGGAFLMPCVTRYLMLSPDQTDEIKLVNTMLSQAGNPPYIMGYAGGEICPVSDESGTLHNRFHNYTFSACVF
jgi:hypothetical protein